MSYICKIFKVNNIYVFQRIHHVTMEVLSCLLKRVVSGGFLMGC